MVKQISLFNDPHYMARPPRAAYFHVPFCSHRCGYCDFTLVTGRDDLVGDYLGGLAVEMDRTQIPRDAVLDSLFFGGGTPTYPAPDALRTLFQLVFKQFGISEDAEITMEANPLDLIDEKIQLLANAGVNRISLGVQSFSKDILERLERNHSPEDITDVMNRLRKSCQNISMDLIFGVPGQTLDSWRETLNRALDLGPTHISTYGLTFERGTAFWTRRERGELIPADEELERDQYALAIELLSSAGYEQYEISNFAKPGFQCRHNNVYWTGLEYWAFGPGAASYLQGRRQTNIRSVVGWLNRIERNESPVVETEVLDAEHRARELIYLGLRRNIGVDRRQFLEQTGFELDAICGETLAQQIRLELIHDDGLSISLTTAGRFIADRVVMEFL